MTTASLPALRRALAAASAALPAILTLCACLGAATATAAVPVVVLNGDAAGEGFNDPTPAAPVGGNAGTTLGEQRLIAFTYAANIWGSQLTSTVPIRILARFDPLPCTASSGVLGSAGAWDVYADFPGALKPNTWYPAALASKLSGTDQSPASDPHIGATFNSRLGLAADCLPGAGFYLGLDGNFGSGTDLVTVLLHEIAHGLGFQTFTDEANGAYYAGTPSIWDHYLLDNQLERSWVEMTPPQRAASAISGNGLSWNGATVNASVPGVLGPVSRLGISGPAAGPAAHDYEVGDASFGPPLANPPLTGQVLPVVDQSNGTGLACAPLSPLNALAVKHNVALVDRGSCPFVQKALNVQNAGAIAMIVVDSVPGPLTGLGGADPAITIPAIRVSQTDGNAIRGQLLRRSRTRSGVIASLGVNPMRLAGTDAERRILMYAPNPVQPGSSVSHYSTDAKPNQLMEPFLSGDLSHDVAPPRDLTLPLLKDIGW
ncbi:peptidase [Pseudoduganella sp. LjRoot289]|uniref:PA domain-containing protein n=1 Tax=Pseudoduganella sp. LjRoot289 TaxID=3342314 RepID=UPI003ECDED50